jgi:peptide chain release factor 1
VYVHKYRENRGWRTSTGYERTSGGFKEVILKLLVKMCMELKFEAGVHRVQRATNRDTRSRAHISSDGNAPEAEEFDVQIDMNDVRVDFFVLQDRRAIGKYN